MELKHLEEKANEIALTLKYHSHELSSDEYMILRRELNNLDIKINAEKSIAAGEWKKEVNQPKLVISNKI